MDQDKAITKAADEISAGFIYAGLSLGALMLLTTISGIIAVL